MLRTIVHTISTRRSLSAVDTLWQMEGYCVESGLWSYLNTTNHPDIPKLVLTSKADRIVVQEDIRSYASTPKARPHHFETGEPVQLLREHPEEYLETVRAFLSNCSLKSLDSVTLRLRCGRHGGQIRSKVTESRDFKELYHKGWLAKAGSTINLPPKRATESGTPRKKGGSRAVE